MTLNDLSRRSVVLVIDELESVAPFGRTAPPKNVDKSAAVPANAAALFNIPVVGDAPKLTPALREALGGKSRGYDTLVVFDACNGVSERSETAAMHRQSQADVVLSSVPAVIGELAIDFADARTGKLFGLLGG